MGFIQDFMGASQRRDAKNAMGAAEKGLHQQEGAISDANTKYQEQFQPYVEGGRQDYASYRNALANGTGDFDKQYFDPRGPLNQSRQIDIDRARRASNAGGNYGGADGGRSGVGALADSRVNYENYYRAQQDWLNRQKGMVDLGYGAAGASAGGYQHEGDALTQAYGANAQMQFRGNEMLANGRNTGLQNGLNVLATAAKFIPGNGGGGGSGGGGGNNIR